MIRLDASRTNSFIDRDTLERMRQEAAAAHRSLLDGTGRGSDFLGWRQLLLHPDQRLLGEIVDTADDVRARADALICIGIGGSYLGAEAVIQALGSRFDGSEQAPEVHFLGHHMGSAYARRLLARLEGKSVVVNVISKSGTTLEPAIAFRLVREWMAERFDDVEGRIIVTTDPSSGALNVMADRYGFRKFVIPPDVGGRFSVLTPVGLLPIACAGIDVNALFEGATSQAERLSTSSSDNIALEYAAHRNALYADGYAVEILASFDPRLAGIQAWWQQLFGESEGKEGEGLYPDAVSYSGDLHSLGQYVQDGQRLLMETFLMVEEDDHRVVVPSDADDADGLNYLSGRTLHEINTMAYQGTAEAHESGGVPNLTLWMDRVAPQTVGALIYAFEHAVAVSGYMLNVNPFDQPGVEAYKKNMFRLLGRP